VADDHPASARATAGSLTASAALASYRSAADFVARSPASAAATSAAPADSGGGGAPAGTGAPEGAGHSQAHVAQAPAAPAPGPKASAVGTIHTVNVERRSVNLSHEPIPSLGLPAMTMDLSVAPSVNLQAVRPGTRVAFTLTRGADGFYMIDSITAAPPGSGAPGSSAPGAGGTPGMGGMPGHGGMGGTGQGGMPAPGTPPPTK
jgi:Cu/Ag efflux protein CusF